MKGLFRRREEPAWDGAWQSYRLKHRKECREIWRRFVPPAGPAETVQGELLREIERLRREACDNGNINWDEDFAWFCENIRDILLGGTLCTPEERDRVVQAVEEIESRGRYAQAWYEGSIPDESWEPERMACVEEGVYDFLCDMAARFYMAQKEPIPYPEDRKTER